MTWDICQDIFQLPGTYAGAIARVTPCLLGQLGWDNALANVLVQGRYPRSPTRMLIRIQRLLSDDAMAVSQLNIALANVQVMYLSQEKP